MTSPYLRYPRPEFTVGHISEGVDDHWVIACEPDDVDVATILFWDCDPDWLERSSAAAQLLAAAPALFNVVKKVLGVIQDLPDRQLPIELLELEQDAIAAVRLVEVPRSLPDEPPSSG